MRTLPLVMVLLLMWPAPTGCSPADASAADVVEVATADSSLADTAATPDIPTPDIPTPDVEADAGPVEDATAAHPVDPDAAALAFRLFYRERVERATVAWQRYMLVGGATFGAQIGRVGLAKLGPTQEIVPGPNDNNDIGTSLWTTWQAYKIFRTRTLALAVARQLEGMVFFEAISGHPGVSSRMVYPGWTRVMDGIAGEVTLLRDGVPALPPEPEDPALVAEYLTTFWDGVVVTHREDPADFLFDYYPASFIAPYTITHSFSALPDYLRVSDCCTSLMKTPPPYAWAGAYWGNHNSRDNHPDMLLGFVAAIEAAGDETADAVVREAAARAVEAGRRIGDLVDANGAALTVDEHNPYGELVVAGAVRPDGEVEDEDLGSMSSCPIAYLARAVSEAGLGVPLVEVALPDSLERILVDALGAAVGCEVPDGVRQCQSLDEAYCGLTWATMGDLEIFGEPWLATIEELDREDPGFAETVIGGFQDDFFEITHAMTGLVDYARVTGQDDLHQLATAALGDLTDLMRRFAEIIYTRHSPASLAGRRYEAALFEGWGGLEVPLDDLGDFAVDEHYIAITEALLRVPDTRPPLLREDTEIFDLVEGELAGKSDAVQARYREHYGDVPPLRRTDAGYEARGFPEDEHPWQVAPNPEHVQHGGMRPLRALPLCLTRPDVLDCTWAKLGCEAADVDGDGAVDSADVASFEATPQDLDGSGAVDDLDAAFLAAAQGCWYGEPPAGDPTLSNGLLSVVPDLDTGRLDVPGHVVRATSAAMVTTSDGEELTWDSADAVYTSWSHEAFSDGLGAGTQLVLTHVFEDGVRLVTRVHLRETASFLTATTELRWRAGAPEGTRVTRLTPLSVVAPDGALLVGPDPATHTILDNGFDYFFDFEARAFQAGKNPSLLFPGGSAAAANWNVAIVDRETDASLVAGFLTVEEGVGILSVGYLAGAATPVDGPAFTRFEGFAHYFGGRAPRPHERGGHHLESELLYLDLSNASGQAKLETFASRYAERIGKVARTDIPSGWNSWGGGAGSGGYGTNIDEALMLANLDAAEQDFLPFGMSHFLIDDGWQVDTGDWFSHPERFPDHVLPDGTVQPGIHWLADHITARGFAPGIWIRAFDADATSQLATDHPDWFAPVDPLGESVVGGAQVLDLSHPEVLAWLHETFTRIVHTWGYRWIKLDFAYYALFAYPQHDPGMTPVEAYTNALQVIRDAVGPETFLLTVAAVGASFDTADGNRITLDNEPWWGLPHSFSEPGYRTTYRTVAHRWYLAHRLWVNHPDLLFFRDTFGLTPAESRTYCSVVALTGGIVKLGDSYLAMHEHPEWRALVEPLLPPYPATATPEDVFHTESPEVWRLPLTREAAPTPVDYEVVGLFHWGENERIGGEALPGDAPRVHTLDIAGPTLAFDAWEHAWTWLDAGAHTETLEPRTDRVLILLPEPEHPTVVATSRHLLGGVVELAAETWDPTTSTLSMTVAAVPGVETQVYVATPGYTATATSAGEWSEDDGVTVVTFVAEAAQTELVLTF